LIAAARNVAGDFVCSRECSAGSVGAALLSETGDVFIGICIDARSSLGFCAEHAAIAEMLKHRQTRIRAIVAVADDGAVLAPCGRCRELIRQTDPANWMTQVILLGKQVEPLSALLPFLEPPRVTLPPPTKEVPDSSWFRPGRRRRWVQPTRPVRPTRRS
jgi:cytidine deaminase